MADDRYTVGEVRAEEACRFIESERILAYRCPPSQYWRPIDGQGFMAWRDDTPVAALVVSEDTITEHSAKADFELQVIGAKDSTAALALLTRSRILSFRSMEDPDEYAEWVATCVSEACYRLVNFLRRREGWNVRVESMDPPFEELPFDRLHVMGRTIVRFSQSELQELPEGEIPRDPYEYFEEYWPEDTRQNFIQRLAHALEKDYPTPGRVEDMEALELVLHLESDAESDGVSVSREDIPDAFDRLLEEIYLVIDPQDEVIAHHFDEETAEQDAQERQVEETEYDEDGDPVEEPEYSVERADIRYHDLIRAARRLVG